MGDLLAEHRVVDVGVRIDVHESDGSVNLVHRPKNGEHDRVVATHRHGDHVVRE